jgi:hypothetical protein
MQPSPMQRARWFLVVGANPKIAQPNNCVHIEEIFAPECTKQPYGSLANQDHPWKGAPGFAAGMTMLPFQMQAAQTAAAVSSRRAVRLSC